MSRFDLKQRLSILGCSMVLTTGLTGPLTAYAADDMQPVELNKTQLAHCGMEGCPVSSTQLMSTSTSSAYKGDTIQAGISAFDSLWGTMLLNMAMQRDPEMRRLRRQSHRVDALTLTSVAAISSLGLAASIANLATINDDPHKKFPAEMAIVGTTGSILSLGARVYYGHRISKAVQARQMVLSNKVMGVLAMLKEGKPYKCVEGDLENLIGLTATQEFAGIWQSAHPVVSTQPAPPVQSVAQTTASLP